MHQWLTVPWLFVSTVRLHHCNDIRSICGTDWTWAQKRGALPFSHTVVYLSNSTFQAPSCPCCLPHPLHQTHSQQKIHWLADIYSALPRDWGVLFHETCHSVTFYFMRTDSKRCCDTTTPESIHTKDESKRGDAFAFIFGVNWPVQWM